MARHGRRLAPLVISAVVALAQLGSAFAGTNGQQIKMYESSNIGSVCIYGYNQNASWVGYCFEASATIFHTNSYAGYWWKTYNGVPVELDYYAGSAQANYMGYNNCSVPEYQSGSDWWQCNSI